MNRPDEATLRRYAQQIQDNPGGRDPPRVVMDALRHEFRDIWRKIQAAPTTYVMTDLEFKILNCFHGEVTNPRLAQGAIRRYWDNPRGTDGTR